MTFLGECMIEIKTKKKKGSLCFLNIFLIDLGFGGHFSTPLLCWAACWYPRRLLRLKMAILG